MGEHYAKKWDAGCVKQMIMVEDEIVAVLRSMVRFPDKEEWDEKVEAVLRKMERMIYEEDYMLYPNCLQFFRRGEGIWMNRSDRDGYANYRALRAKADVPALFLSARDADADRLFGLGLGADDYLTKPFLMQELLLRVQHILQRAYRAELSRTKPAPLQLGERCVDLNDAIVTLPEGKTLALTATELALLRKLAENRGHIVTYDALCAAVWGADYYGYENSLGVHIRHLREKLEAEPGAPQILRTVRGIGYTLTKGEEA